MGENDTRDTPSRLTPRAPDAPPSGDRADNGRNDDSGYGGGNLVGSNESGLEAAARSESGTRHDSDSQGGGQDQPIGSALSQAKGRNPGAGDGDTAGAGQDLSSGSSTMGATTGGERAVAGRADPDRSSRDDGNSLQEKPSRTNR